MQKYSQEFLEYLKSKVSLVDHLRQYLQVRRSGLHFVSLCPFHGDKTPSLYIYSNHYHCFACKAHGSIFDFEAHRTGKVFPDVVKDLAEKYGVEIPKLEASEKADRWQARNRQTSLLLADIASIYHQEIKNLSKSHRVIEVVQKRGLTWDDLIQWQLGWAPEHSLIVQKYQSLKTEFQNLMTLGVVRKYRENSVFFDFFRSRLIIPVADIKGNVRGFGARTINPQIQPKYLNSTDSFWFKKSELLFNLHMALPEIKRKRTVILVEGYFDAIALHKSGILNSCAVLGTALTHEHANLLSKIAREVIIAFDSDAAGFSALLRSYKEIFPTNTLHLKGLGWGAYKDPDEFLQASDSVEKLAFHVENQSKPLIEFIMDAFLLRHGEDKLALLESVREELIPTVLRHPDRAVQEITLETMNRYLGLTHYTALLPQTPERRVSEKANTTSSLPAPSGLKKEVQNLSQEQKISDDISWQVNSIEELRFLITLMCCRNLSLPEWLTDLVYHPEPAETVLEIAKIVANFFTHLSKNLFLYELRRIDDDFSEDFDGAFIADFILAILENDSSYSYKGLKSQDYIDFRRDAQKPQFYVGNALDLKNIPYVAWLIKDMAVTRSSGGIVQRLEHERLRLLLRFIEHEIEVVQAAHDDLSPEHKNHLRQLWERKQELSRLLRN